MTPAMAAQLFTTLDRRIATAAREQRRVLYALRRRWVRLVLAFWWGRS